MDIILGLGILLLLGLIGGKISHYLGLPSVTGYLLMGLLLGPSCTGIIKGELLEKLLPINSFALSFIALLMGKELKRDRFKNLGRGILQLPFFESLCVFLFVTTTMILLKQPPYLALLLGTISMATAPGPLVAIIKGYRAKGPLSDILLTTTAMDNLLTIILFGPIVALARFQVAEKGGENLLILQVPLMAMVFSCLWGGVMGLFLSYSVSQSRSKGEELTLVLSIPLLAGGLAWLFDLSTLLSLMVMGFVTTNIPGNQRIFHTIDSFMLPLLIAFLTFGGVKLDIMTLQQVGVAGIGAAIARILGKVIGSIIGSPLPLSIPKPYLGLGLTPMAGVSIGLSIIGEEKLPFLEGRLLAITLFMVLIFDLIGPPLTVISLKKAREME